MSHIETAAKIIKDIIYLNLSSVCEDGAPWCSPVYCAYDNELNFYWTSTPKNIHSQNVVRDGRVFVTIYDSTVPEGAGKGVYMTGHAKVIETVEAVQAAREHTQSRKGKEADPWQAVIFTGDSIRKVYQFTPEKIWLNDDESDDEGNYVHDIRVGLDIGELKSYLFSKDKYD